MNDVFIYRAKIHRWVDADTVDCLVDLGFSLYAKYRFRLLGIDAPEMRTDEGKAAKQFVCDTYPEGTQIVLESHKQDSFGRWLGKLICEGVCINDALMEAGHAVKYDR